jgi:hypothetical protein
MSWFAYVPACIHSLVYHITHTHIQMLELLDSEDPCERDYLKTMLHRLYAKLLHLRTFIRQTVNHIFFSLVRALLH